MWIFIKKTLTIFLRILMDIWDIFIGAFLFYFALMFDIVSILDSFDFLFPSWLLVSYISVFGGKFMCKYERGFLFCTFTTAAFLHSIA